MGDPLPLSIQVEEQFSTYPSFVKTGTMMGVKMEPVYAIR